MSVKTFVDSNILIYARDLDSGMRLPQASDRLKDLWQDFCALRPSDDMSVGAARKSAYATAAQDHAGGLAPKQ